MKKDLQPIYNKTAGRLMFSVIIVHNLHRIIGLETLEMLPMTFYLNWYLFLFVIEHSLAPLLALIGAFLVVDSQYRTPLSVAIGYETYKTVEKIPFKGDHHVYDEYLWVGLLFTFIFTLTIKLFYAKKSNK